MQGHIVFTGATGVIGTELAMKLIGRGEKVVVFARTPSAAEKKVPGAAAYVRWDAGMADGEWVDYLDGAKAVVHLAGKPLLESRWSEEHKKECYDSRIVGTRNLVAAMARATSRPPLLLSASAIGYYGSFESCGDTADILEDGAKGGDFLARICIDWEREALEAEKLGTRVVLLRTGIVLSTRGGMLQQMLTPFNMFVGGPVGSGRQCISWIHLDDEIDAILAALDSADWSGPINLVGPKPVSMKAFADTLGRVLARPSLLSVPKLAVQLLLGEGADYAVKGQKVLPGFLQRQQFTFRYPGLDAALQELIESGR